MRHKSFFCQIIKEYSLFYISVVFFIILVTFFNQNLLGNGYADNNNHSPNLQKFNFVTAGDFGCGDDFKLKCKEGSNSPLNRPEFVDVEVSK